MDAATAREYLRNEGIQCVVHRTGRLTARLTRPADEPARGLSLRDRVEQIPGATVIVTRDCPASDRYFRHHDVVFEIGGVGQ